jgi:hypothetical protein
MPNFQGPPLSLRDISPKGEKILIRLFEFLIRQLDISPLGGSARRARGVLVILVSVIWFNRQFCHFFHLK